MNGPLALAPDTYAAGFQAGLEEAARICENIAQHFKVDNKSAGSPRAVGVSAALKRARYIRHREEKS